MVNHPSDLGFCTQLRMGWTLLPKLLFSSAPSIYLPLSLPGEREKALSLTPERSKAWSSPGMGIEIGFIRIMMDSRKNILLS